MLDETMLRSYAEIGKIMSSESRIQILTYLLSTSRSVEEISELTNLSIANVSKHLQTLLKSGFVKNQREGLYIVYDIADADTAMMIERYLSVGYDFHQKRSEILNELSNVRKLEPYTLDELDTLMKQNDIILIDVRPTEEYMHAHISGAISLPVEALQERLKTIPSDKIIVAYCRGPHCLLSEEAVKILEAAGRKAVRSSASVNEWIEYERMNHNETRNHH